MAASRKLSKFFETRYFGFVIGVFVFALILVVESLTGIFETIELKVLDTHFRYKDLVGQTRSQEGVTVVQRDLDISKDILIIGIDFRALDAFGRWPFPRYREANLVDNFTRIQDQSQRERSIFLDIFFVEPADKAYNDVLLIDAIEENERVFLETVLDETPPPGDSAEEYYERQRILYEKWGEIRNIEGRWDRMRPYVGLQPPLQPYARATHGYGHANFVEDRDGLYRRQPLVAKSSVLVEEIRLEDLTADTPVDRKNFERLEWVDRDDVHHTIPYPLTEKIVGDLKERMERDAPPKIVDSDSDGEADDRYFIVRKYKDHFVPSITLSLALDYLNVDLEDITVVLGKHIYIPSPQYFDVDSEQWVPYRTMTKAAVVDPETQEVVQEAEYRRVDQINIPIDDQGSMLINFMGLPSFATPDGHQTFPVRSFYGYAAAPTTTDPSRWPRTRAVENKILMVGAFERGIADDKKPTPYGLMYGVEIHANALNTILMSNFLIRVPKWVDALILGGLVLLIAFMAARLSTIWSLVASVFLVLALFISVSVVFDEADRIVSFSVPAVGILLTFLSVVVYRVMTEEKDKRRIRDMFGKYVSPRVVSEILEKPPELGGVDKELTVFFSDIRGFTSLSESMPPQELVNHLNLYLTAMTDIIMEYRGTLDKYVGDEIMCFWGAPLPQPDHAILACKCALRQMRKLHELNETWPEERRINIGIGLNSGIMTVGNMGSMGRMNYTLTGDGVNLGARLEGTNKQYFTNIIISEYTYGLVRDEVIVRELDNIRVKGKNKPVVIYELVDVVGSLEAPSPEQDTKERKRDKHQSAAVAGVAG